MKITLISPFDGHVHFRDGDMLKKVLFYSVKQFSGALIMPNLMPPVVTTEQVKNYRTRIMAILPEGIQFLPAMTAYLTAQSDPGDVQKGFEEGVFIAGKLYPPGGTTNSEAGVTNLADIFSVLEVMEKIGMPLCVHGETPPDPHIDIFDREKEFIDTRMISIKYKFPRLKIVFEHITTKDACDFIVEYPDTMMATVTPQHLLFDRNAIFEGGLQPDMYCMPILKERTHVEAIQKFVASGHKQFALGTDSAPHLKASKYQPCGCAGIFSAPVALEAYATFFDDKGVLDAFPAFACKNLPNFYGLKLPDKKVTLRKFEEGWTVPINSNGITPLFAGKKLHWKVM